MPEAGIPCRIDRLSVLEQDLLAAGRGLVRAEGLLAAVRDDLLPGDALAAGLAEAAEVLRQAGLPFALVLDRGSRYRVAIRPGDRPAVLEACAEAFRGQAVYADLLGHGHTHRTVLASMLPEAVAEWEHVEPQPEGPDAGAEPVQEPELVKGVRLYRAAVTSGGTLFYGADHGCDLEFWDSAEPGVVASIAETPFGWWLPSLRADSRVRVGDAEYPAVGALARSFPDDVDFPVDAVITWVDDADPAWRHRRDEAWRSAGGAGTRGIPQPRNDDHRYHSRDELRYCLRSIAMYAPWIRRIFLVTDGQVPSWLDTEDPRLTVVFHSGLFPDNAGVFNSHAIETQLHRIDGLAEHFLYFNDDMFLGRALRPQDFFQGNGMPLVFRDRRIIPPADTAVDSGDVYVRAQQTTRTAVERELGRTFTQVLSHAPYPLRRSVLAEAGERWRADLAATSRSAFRSGSDVAPVTLATYYAYLTGRAATGSIVHEYLETDRVHALDRLAEVLSHRQADVICLADGDAGELPRDEQDRAVVAFLQAYFPVPGPFELTCPEPATEKEEGPGDPALQSAWDQSFSIASTTRPVASPSSRSQ